MPVTTETTHRDLIQANNRYVNLRTGEITERSPVPGTPAQTYDFDYKPFHERSAPLWESVLMEIFNNDLVAIRTLQKAFGYLLTGHTSDRVIIMLNSLTEDAGKYVIVNVFSYLTNGIAILGSRQPEEGKPQFCFTRPLDSFTAEELHTLAEDTRAKTLLLVNGAETGYSPRFNSAFAEIEWKCGVVPITFPCNFNDNPLHAAWFVRPKIAALAPFLTRTELPGILSWAVEGAKRWYAEPFRDDDDNLQFENAEYQNHHHPVIRSVDFAMRKRLRKQMWESEDTIRKTCIRCCSDSAASRDRDYLQIFKSFGYHVRLRTREILMPSSRSVRETRAIVHGIRKGRTKYHNGADQYVDVLSPPSHVILILYRIQDALEAASPEGRDAVLLDEAVEIYQEHHDNYFASFPKPGRDCIRVGLEKLGYIVI